MKTIKDTGPQLIGVHSTASRKEIPEGKIRITFVRYLVCEYDRDELDSARGSFHVHDANQEEAKLVARAVKS